MSSAGRHRFQIGPARRELPPCLSKHRSLAYTAARRNRLATTRTDRQRDRESGVGHEGQQSFDFGVALAYKEDAIELTRGKNGGEGTQSDREPPPPRQHAFPEPRVEVAHLRTRERSRRSSSRVRASSRCSRSPGIRARFWFFPNPETASQATEPTLRYFAPETSKPRRLSISDPPRRLTPVHRRREAGHVTRSPSFEPGGLLGKDEEPLGTRHRGEHSRTLVSGRGSTSTLPSSDSRSTRT